MSVVALRPRASVSVVSSIKTDGFNPSKINLVPRSNITDKTCSCTNGWIHRKSRSTAMSGL